MNLLYTITGYPPAIGGAQAYMHGLARQLLTRHGVRVAAYWDRTRTDWLLGTTLRAPRQSRAYEIDGVPVHLIAPTTGERLGMAPAVAAYYLLKGPAIEQIAARVVRHLAPLAGDAGLVHNGRMGREPLSFASLHLARRLDLPFVLTPFHHPRWVGWNYRHYLRLYRQADALLALTEAERQALIGLGVAPERITVTGMGPVLAPSADAGAFRRRFRLEGPLVLFVGQKYRYKGIEALLQAAPLVWAEVPGAQFVFVGPGTRHSRSLFARHRDPRIVDLGAVDLATKTDALAACSLLCLPSAQESFGAVLVEAWMMDKPVLGGPAPAVQEVIDDGVDGFVVSQEPEALARRIVELLARPALAEEMGRRGKEKALARFTWPRLAAKTEAVYRDLVR
ncbi:MAG: glycosyltransferase family 4 protein [Anaerolineae bacterium]